MQTYTVYIGIAFALFVGIVAGFLLAQLSAWAKDVELQLEKLKARIDEVESKPKRHTQATDAGLLDAIAISIDILNEYEASQKYSDARMRQLQQVLQRVRSGPYAYDPDAPAGERPKKRHER